MRGGAWLSEAVALGTASGVRVKTGDESIRRECVIGTKPGNSVRTGGIGDGLDSNQENESILSLSPGDVFKHVCVSIVFIVC